VGTLALVSSGRRLSGVDGLRGLACVGVIVLHVWMYTGQNDPGQNALLNGVLGELRQGLTYFFALSAFLLTTPWIRAALDGARRPTLGRYALHRVARVGPAYWISIAGAFAILAGSGHQRAVGAEWLPVYAVFAQNHVEATLGQLNPPTWSLGVEVAFYLTLPFIGWAIVRAGSARGRAGILGVCAALLLAGMGYTLAGELAGWAPTAMTSYPVWLSVFVAGIAAAALAHGRTVSRRTAWALLAAGWLLVILNGLWHAPGTGLLGHVLRDFPAAAGFGAIIVAVVSRPPGLLDLPPVRWLGTVSLGAYLWHMPVVYALRLHDAFPREPVPAMLAVLVPSFALAAVSWYAVERPILRRTAALAKRRGQRYSPSSAHAPWRARAGGHLRVETR
jgi:peptidoglycan/LPS O-acetylase OafA/YrhL